MILIFVSVLSIEQLIHSASLQLPKSQTNGHAVPVSVVSEDNTATKQQSSPRSNVRSSPAKQLSPGRTTPGGKVDQKVDSPKVDSHKKSEQLKKVIDST